MSEVIAQCHASGERNSSRGIFNEMGQSVRMAILCEQAGATSEVVMHVDVCGC